MITKKKKNFKRRHLAEYFGMKGFNNGVEIGVCHGTFSKVLCDSNPKLLLKSIDPYVPVFEDPRTIKIGAKKQEELFKQASKLLKSSNCEIIKKTSSEAVSSFDNESIDFVYIDGSHEFDYVMTDIIEWTRKVRKGGIVAGHDYCKNYEDVKTAVNTYADIHGIETVFLTDEKTPSWWFVKPRDEKDTISELLAGYDTDKNKNVKGAHCYGNSYDVLFSEFDRDQKLDIIEIGVEKGWSLIAWKEFFKNANVTGVDIVDAIEERREDIKYVISDIYDLGMHEEFDIVIDDGSHKMRDVLWTVENVKLKKGGMMIIEDCQAPDHWTKAVKKRTEYSVETIDLREINGQHDDFLIILRNDR